MTESRALISEKDARLLNRIMLDIAKEVRIDRRFNGRVNNLHLLADFQRPDETVARKSAPEYRDHPQIQILLERRDRYLECRRTLLLSEQALERVISGGDDISPQDVSATIRAVAKHEIQCAEHLRALENCFIAIRQQTAFRTKLLSDMVAKAATMAEASRRHTERLELARQQLDSRDVNDLLAEVVRDDGDEET